MNDTEKESEKYKGDAMNRYSAETRARFFSLTDEEKDKWLEDEELFWEGYGSAPIFDRSEES